MTTNFTVFNNHVNEANKRTRVLINHAKSAAATHSVAVRVHEGEEFDGERFTGRFVCSVEFHQSVWTRPEYGRSNKALVSDIENRRIIGVSATDARRLSESRKGRPGGQEYIVSNVASESIRHVAETPEEACRVVLNALLSGKGRSLAHMVADEAATIEVEMRKQLRDDLEAIQ